MSVVPMSQPLLTASLTRIFCELRELVPAYRSISFLSTSLKPLTVSLARMVRRASAARLPPDVLTDVVGSSHLNLRTHRVSMMFLASVLLFLLKHLYLAQVLSSLTIASSTSFQLSLTCCGVRMSSSLCTTCLLVPPSLVKYMMLSPSESGGRSGMYWVKGW